MSRRVSRRTILRSAGAVACSAAVAVSGRAAVERAPLSFSRVLDLTHTLHAGFPSPFEHGFSVEPAQCRPRDRWNINRWHLVEHVGTHLDAPLHCTELDSADAIPATNLVGPLAVIDIREKAGRDADSLLNLNDLKDWEAAHGPIPRGAVVALCSGWDAHVHDARKFLGLANGKGCHLPGFDVEAVRWLDRERDVIGIATDTISLDAGRSSDFPVHHYWLGRNKWGLENVANLASVPPVGATTVVGGPKVAGATGGPSRVVALV